MFRSKNFFLESHACAQIAIHAQILPNYSRILLLLHKRKPHKCLKVGSRLNSSTAVPNIFGTRDRFCGRQFFHRRRGGEDGAGGNGSDGERADEASLTHPPLTSCCAARFLTGPGVGTPVLVYIHIMELYI